MVSNVTASTLSVNNAISVKINIERRSVTGAAPEGILFTARITGQNALKPNATTHDPRLHNVYYFWDYYFEGTDNSYPWPRATRVHSGHQKSRYTYGPQGAHVYRKAGTYTVKCTAFEPSSGKSGVGTRQITVRDPNAYFAGANTIFIDPSGKYVGAPPGAIKRAFRGIEDALNMIDGQQSVPKRIMLAAGQSFTLNKGQYGNGTDIPTTHIVAQPGSRPQVTLEDGIAWNDKTAKGIGQKDFVLQGMDFQGGWNPITQKGNAPNLWTCFENGPNTAIFDDVTADGVNIGFYTSATVSSMNLHRATFVNDSAITNYRMYGALEGDRFATVCLGSAIKMDPDAYTDSTHNGGACWREGGNTLHRVFHSNDFFAVCGWSGVARGAAITIASMPVLRLNTGGYDGALGTVACNVIEGGRETVTLNAGTSKEPNNPCNIVLEKNDIKSNYHTISLISSQMGGVTIRNNRMTYTRNTGAQVELDGGPFVRLNNLKGGIGNASAPCRIHHNTMINQRDVFRTRDRPAAEYSVEGFDDVAVENNVVHQPATSPSQVAYAPLAQSVNVGTPLNRGYRTLGFAENAGKPPAQDLRRDSATDVTAGLYDTFAPQTGSAAIGEQIGGDVPADDFYGHIRVEIVRALKRTRYSRGSIEPNLEK